MFVGKVRDFFISFYQILLFIMIIQFIQICLGWPDFNLFYSLVITLILTIGDLVAQLRFICFFLGLFLLDISLTYILLPFFLIWAKPHFILARLKNKNKKI